MKILLILLYPLMQMVGVTRRILGRDVLQLRPPSPSTSFWLPRLASPNVESYFSEASVVEGKSTKSQHAKRAVNGGTRSFLVPVFMAVARWNAPPRATPGKKFYAAAEREQGIPDEVYTLW